MKKPDRRVLRTRQMLQDALLELIAESAYDAITIQDIVERANLAKATFYLHYTDKDELLSSALKASYDALVEKIRGFEDERQLTLPFIEKVFEHIGENQDLYRVILHGASRVVFERTQSYLVSQILRRLQWINRSGRIPSEIVATFVAGALFNLITYWLNTEPTYSAREVAHMFHRLALSSLTAIQPDTAAS